MIRVAIIFLAMAALFSCMVKADPVAKAACHAFCAMPVEGF